MRHYCYLLLSLPLLAQVLSISVNTTLALLDVSVRDNSGIPLTNLDKSAFSIREDGRPQAIAVFIKHSEDHSKKRVTGSPLLQSDNIHAFLSLAVVVDTSSVQPGQLRRAKGALADFLARHARSVDRISFTGYNGMEERETGFLSRDRISDMEWAIAGPSAKGRQIRARQQEESGTTFNGLDGNSRLLSYPKGILEVLTHISQKVGLQPGHRAILYLCGGVESAVKTGEIGYQNLFNVAKRDAVTIFVVDIRGLTALPPGGAAANASSSSTAIVSGAAQAANRDGLMESFESMQAIANATGGEMCSNTNDLGACIDRTFDGISSYYEVGYYSHLQGDQKPRGVAVQITKGNRLHYHVVVVRAMTSRPQDPAEQSGWQNDTEENVTASTSINSALLHFCPDANHYFICARTWAFGQAGMTTLFLDAGVGGPKVIFDNVEINDYPIELPIHDDSSRPFACRVIPAGEYRVSVEDGRGQGSKRFLSVVDFPVRQTNSELKTSSLTILSSEVRVERLIEAIDGAHATVEFGPVDSPNTAIRKNKDTFLYFEVYDGPDEEASFGDLIAEASAMDGQQVVWTSGATHAKAIERHRARFEVPLPIDSFAPGPYTIQVNVAYLGRAKFAFIRRKITVEEMNK